MNNFNILDLKKRIQNSLKESRNSVALKSLNPVDFDRSPTNTDRCKANLSGAYTKNVAYKMEFTKGHVERTTKMSHIIQEPFKRNYLSFESTKKYNMKKNLAHNKNKTQ